MTDAEFQRIMYWLALEFEQEMALVKTEADAKALRARWLGKKGVVRYLEHKLVGREWPHPIPGAVQ